MSLINKMLQDLEARQGGEPERNLDHLSGSLRPAYGRRRRWRGIATVVSVLVVLSAAAAMTWYVWPEKDAWSDRLLVMLAADGESPVAEVDRQTRPAVPAANNAPEAGPVRQPPVTAAPAAATESSAIDETDMAESQGSDGKRPASATAPAADDGTPAEPTGPDPLATVGASAPRAGSPGDENPAIRAGQTSAAEPGSRRADPARGIKSPSVVAEQRLEKRPRPVAGERSAESMLASAAGLLQQRDLAGAERLLRQLLSQVPMHRQARELLAGLLLRQGRRPEARAVLRQGLASHPGHMPFVMLLARLRVDAGETAAAIQLLESAGGASANHPDRLGFLGALYQRSGRWAEAVQAYRQALGQRPGEARWWLGLAIALEGGNRPQQAVDAYYQARSAGKLEPRLVQYVDRRLEALQR
jgi:MSHA biogenesis protein MshN